MDAVGAGGERRIGEDRSISGPLGGFGDLALGGCDHDRPDLRLGGAPADLHDHRQPRDLGQGFAGKAGGGQTRGNEDDGIGWRGHWTVFSGKLRRFAAPKCRASIGDANGGCGEREDILWPGRGATAALRPESTAEPPRGHWIPRPLECRAVAARPTVADPASEFFGAKP